MGLFEARKQRRAVQAAAKLATQLHEDAQNWQNNADSLEAMLVVVRDCRNGKMIHVEKGRIRGGVFAGSIS